MINICGCVCIPGAKEGMLELIPQTLFFLERARVNTEGGSGYARLQLPSDEFAELNFLNLEVCLFLLLDC